MLLRAASLAAVAALRAADAAPDCPPNYTGFSLRSGTACREFVHCQNGFATNVLACPDGTRYTGAVGEGGICNFEDVVACKDVGAEEGPPPVVVEEPAGDDNPDHFYCGINRRDAAKKCLACPSGGATECADPAHGCFRGIARCAASSVADGTSEGALTEGVLGGEEVSTATDEQEVDEPNEAPTNEVGASTNYASALASNVRVTIDVGPNFDHDEDCSMADWELCYTQTLVLEYTGDEDYLDSQFKIYFSAIHRVLQVNHPDFEHEHIVGDLTYIQPTSSFQGFQANGRLFLPIVREYWSVQESDNMPRWFVVDDRDQSTAVIPNTDTEDLHSFVVPYTSTMKTATDANIKMTASSRFSLNEKLVREVDFDERIIPAPYRTVVDSDAAKFVIGGIDIQNLQLLGKLRMGALDLGWTLGISGGDATPHRVTLMVGALPTDIAGPESYTLEVASGGTTITGTDPSGLFHGLMSFMGLLDVSDSDRMTMKEMTIHDKPRFSYRGHQVDVARNFRSKEAIMKTIDAMALWKLNVLHLALTNDEGWRLEIPGLEELTTVGSKRCFDPNEETCLLTQLGSGPDAKEGQFYTREEYIELLKYAEERNVRILPEFNMPAHARSAVISMEARARNGDDSYRLTDPEDDTFLLTIQFYDRTSIINPCLDSSVRFVEKLVAEVKQMHDDAGIPLDSYHFGGDEAKNIMLGAGYASYPDDLKQAPFSKSPACQAKALADPTFDVGKIANYWATTVNSILSQHGIDEMVAWEDGLRGTTKEQYATQSVAVNFWETLFWGGINGLADISDDGFDIIMSNPDYLYFDFPYEVNPEERGYYWAARFNSVAKVFSFAPENLAQNAETSTDRDGNEMSVTTPNVFQPTIRGMQGQTWSETIRTDGQYYEMAFPRALAVAERAWHRASWELDWSPGETYNATTGHVPKDELADDFNGFASALGCREAAKLEKLGIGYRVPPPGASIDAAGVLRANSEMPCTAIMYSVDGGGRWSEYLGPVGVGVSSVVSLQSVSHNGALKSRVVVADGECDDCGYKGDNLNEGKGNILNDRPETVATADDHAQDPFDYDIFIVSSGARATAVAGYLFCLLLAALCLWRV